MKPQTSEEQLYDDYPSRYITGRATPAYSLNAYELTGHDLKNIFAALRGQIEGDSHGDIDGERYELDYKVFRIEAVHHLRAHLERGSDSYCGQWAMIGIIDEDRIEVRRVFDEEGKDYPGYVAKLNDYARRNNL